MSDFSCHNSRKGSVDLFEKKKQCILPQIGESFAEQRDSKGEMNVFGIM